MTQIVLFLGPTMPAAEAARLIDAQILPPCRMGDVYAAVTTRKPAAIGIVDGYFESTPAVWHKEILYALSQGVAVFGASSMGALRGAELAAFGMQGVGEIFAAYASGALTDDDEVAVAHGTAEDGYPLSSVPMVNIRHALAAAVEQGLISDPERLHMIGLFKQVHYPRRRWPLIWDDTLPHGLTPERRDALRRFVAAGDFDLKRADARRLCAALADWRASGAPAHQPDFQLEPTIFWDHMVSLVEPQSGQGADAGTARLVEQFRVTAADRREVMRAALGDRLIAREAQRVGIAAGDDRAALMRFRQERGLHTAHEMSAWIARNSLDADACLELARSEARARALMRRMMPEVLDAIPSVLRRQGGFGAARDAANRTAATLARRGIADPSVDHVDSADALLAWYQRKLGPVSIPFQDHVAELGFGTTQQFTRALVAAYLSAHEMEQSDGIADKQAG